MPRRKVRRGTRLWRMIATASRVISLRRQLAAAIKEFKATCRNRLKCKARRPGSPATASRVAGIRCRLVTGIKLLIAVFRRKISSVTAVGKGAEMAVNSRQIKEDLDNHGYTIEHHLPHKTNWNGKIRLYA
ncbi:hypothetical protein F5B18DRAFT_655483 [Nemania serpens]|nr:hypothetical protein F5B18DRAFT_655483 [Nemania serpens]